MSHSSRGMSLIEILVGLAIGMIGVLVIFQTMAVWGARTATTISGGDARTTGAIAMYYLERDLQQGGLGFGMSSAIGTQFKPGCAITSGGTNFLLSAATIVEGANADGGHNISGDPDQLTVLYAGSTDSNVNFTDVALFEQDKTTPGGAYSYQGPALLRNVRVILANSGTCELNQVNRTDQPTLNGITFSTPPGITQGSLMSLGTAPQRATWRIDSNRLVREESVFSTVASEIADGVVDLQAEYGFVDKAGVWTWTASSPPASAPPNAQWAQLRAVKVAILVRSKQFEKPGNDGAVATPDANVPVWHSGSGADVKFRMKNIDGATGALATCPCAPDTNDWHQYRYEVFERVIPLRNLIWGAQS